MISKRRMRRGHQRSGGNEESRVACFSSVRILENEDDLRTALDRAAMFERVISSASARGSTATRRAKS